MLQKALSTPPPNQQNSEGEQERQARNNVVRARPLPASTFQRTFELKPSEHAPVLAEAAPRLATETRAEQRAEYEERVREREAAKRRAEAAKEAERRKALEAEERRLRATPVGEGGHQFTARPVGYQGQGGVRVRQGARVEKVLTVPISPMLQTKARAHVRVVPSAASAPPQG